MDRNLEDLKSTTLKTFTFQHKTLINHLEINSEYNIYDNQPGQFHLTVRQSKSDQLLGLEINTNKWKNKNMNLNMKLKQTIWEITLCVIHILRKKHIIKYH